MNLLRKVRWDLFGMLVCLALVTAPSPAFAQQQLGDRSVVVQRGDALSIQVWKREDLSGTFDIDEMGRVEHPIYKSLTVAGKSVQRIDEELFAFLRDWDEHPRFIVKALIKVSVEGSVSRPNIYRIPAPTTAAEAIAVAGGSVGRPNLERIRIIRGSGVKEVDLHSADESSSPTMLESGDRVIVSSKTSILQSVILPIMGLSSGLYSILRLVRVLQD